MNVRYLGLSFVVVLISAAIPPFVASRSIHGGRERDFFIKARRYAYDPPKIIVNKGDKIRIRLASLDVVHGFFLEGYDIDAEIEPGVRSFKLRHPSEGDKFVDVNEIDFTAQHAGKFRYRCSHTCGTMHPFMQGEMIVRPDYPFLAGLGGAAGILISAFLMMFIAARRRTLAAQAEES
jgi:heme/copper-type cytochrome/quinol oxidase subunit 2